MHVFPMMDSVQLYGHLAQNFHTRGYICIIVKVTDIDFCLAQIFQPSKEANYVHITCMKAVLTTYALSKLYASIV